MTTENENVTTSNAQASVKKNRRGVSNKTKAVAQLRFHEKDAAQNGLFIAHLDSVSVDWSTNADAKVFTGMAVPRLTFHFASNHILPTEQRHVYYAVNPIESNVLTIPGGTEEWKVNNVFNWIKHILEVFYLKGREFTEEEEELLTLPFEDYDDNNNYIAIEPETVIAGYRQLFENACNMFNGNFNLKDGEVAKPCYKTADGKFIPCWIKLLRHKKIKNEWKNVAQNGELGFDSFLGNGVVELIKKDTAPSILRIDLAKESITPKETKKVPSIGVPGVPNNNLGNVSGTSNMFGLPNDMANSAFNAADSEMPF